MKEKKFLDAFGQIEDRFIEESNPENAREIVNEYKKDKNEKRKRWIKRAFITATCSIVLALSLWLFIPYRTAPPSVKKYSASNYYSVIQKLNDVTFKKPRYVNNFDWIISNLFPLKMSGGAPSEVGPSENGSYEETTDNQVDGVIEADLLKRTDKYAFYLSVGSYRLNVYKIDKENTSKVTSYQISTYDAGTANTYGEGEMFLSADGKTVTVIACYSILSPESIYARGHYYEIISLDVSNVNEIKEIGRVTVSGKYKTSRLVDGKVLVISDFTVATGVDFSKEEDFLPSIKIGDKKEVLPYGDIVSPDILTNSNYTVICKFDQKTLNVEGKKAFLSYSEAVYVSSGYVYINRATSEEISSDSYGEGVTVSVEKTEIIPISYGGNDFKVEKSIVIDGSVKDQYSLDEFGGKLRVVTTVRERALIKNGSHQSIISTDINSNLYVIDLSSMQEIASVKKFAPKGESVMAVRFDKNLAYVCTAVEFTDPVFMIDMTDLNDIKIVDSGVIDGFSTSLVDFGEGYLLGIGVNQNEDLKIEIYSGGLTSVNSVCKYEVQDSQYSSDYKAYYIDRENKLIGLGVSVYENTWQSEYKLLKFDGLGLTEIAVNFSFTSSSNDYLRADLIDGYFYIFSPYGCDVTKIS